MTVFNLIGSEIEAKDQILTTWQCSSSSSSSSSSGPEEEVIHADVIDADVIQQPKTVVMPQNITSKLFVPRTAEMVSPFLDLDDVKGIDSEIPSIHSISTEFMTYNQ